MEIEFKNVSYVYNYRTPLRKTALKNINVNIKENRINAILGKCGSGKTTMIELILALLKPTRGKIYVGPYLVEKNIRIKRINDLRFDVGLIFQFPEDQIFNTTVKSEIEFGMKYFNYKVKDIHKRTSDALKMVGLDDSYLTKNPLKLSRGEMRKVAIASVLAFNPRVLIFDEPTVGLDSISKRNFIKLIQMLKNKYNRTIILVSHDTELVYKCSDYTYVLNDGELVLEGDTKEVLTNSKLHDYGLQRPQIVEMIDYINKTQGLRIGYRSEINDLIKDIYRNAR